MIIMVSSPIIIHGKMDIRCGLLTRKENLKTRDVL